MLPCSLMFALRLCLVSPLGATAASYHAALLRVPPANFNAIRMSASGESSSGDVKVTIRKRKPVTSEALQRELDAKEANDARLARLLADDGDDSTVFAAKFYHVKPSLATLLKFWLMGGCGAEGWSGTGELEAQHTSGTQASIVVDVENATVSLRSTSEPSYNRNVQLSRLATVLLNELEGVARTEEAAEADRLCHPPEAVDSARAMASSTLANSD